jgi:hypothetical protein
MNQRRDRELLAGRRPSMPAPARRPADAGPTTEVEPTSDGGLMALQQRAGNAAVAQMLAAGPIADDERPIDATDAPSATLGPTGQAADRAGKPLDTATRAEMEAAFDTDFSSVRVHRGGDASSSAQALGARAYTMGEDIVVGDHGEDRRTIAHELAHVVQQRSGQVDGTPTSSGVSISDPADRFERAAAATAASVVAGGGPVGPGHATMTPGPAAAQRQAEDDEPEDTVQTAKDEEEIPDIPVEDLPKVPGSAGAGTPVVSVEDLPKVPGTGPVPDIPVEDLPKVPGSAGAGTPVVSVEDLPLVLPDVTIVGQAPGDKGAPPKAVDTSGAQQKANAGDVAASQGDAKAVGTTKPAGSANAAQPARPIAVGGSALGPGSATPTALLGALWGAAVVTPIREASTAIKGDRPDYKAALGSLRQARGLVIAMMAELPAGDPRLAVASQLTTELELYIEVSAKRANVADDLGTMDISSTIGYLADDAANLGSSLGRGTP